MGVKSLNKYLNKYEAADEVSKDSIQLDLVRLFMLQFVADKVKNVPLQQANDWSGLYTRLQSDWRKMDRLYLDKVQTLSEMIFDIERRL